MSMAFKKDDEAATQTVSLPERRKENTGPGYKV
jgi:hypothetical protein